MESSTHRKPTAGSPATGSATSRGAGQRVLPSRTEPMARGFIRFIGGPPGAHALIGRANWWTPLRVLLATAATFLVFGWLQKAQCIRTGFDGDGNPFVDWSGKRQFTSACYSDTISLYAGRGLDNLDFPYFTSFVDDGVTRYMEYPVLTGLYQWLMAAIARPVEAVWNFLPLPQVAPAAIYFGVNAFFLALFWLIATGLMTKLTGNRVWDTLLMAASPLVIVHAFTNFDLLTCAAAVAIFVFWANRRPGWAGVATGVGVALKLWPAFIGGALILLCLRQRAWVPLAKLVGWTFGSWLVINLPIMAFAPEGWSQFFKLNSERGWEGSTIYAVIAHIVGNDAWNGVSPTRSVEGVETLNLLTGVLLLIALLALAWLVIFAAPRTPRVGQVAFLATLAFMITNKVWSPQYSIWLVPLLVLALPRWRLVFGWAALETVYWYLRMWQFLPANQAAPHWLVDTVTIVRLGLLVFMAVLVIRQIMGRSPDPIREAHGGRDPLAGVLAEELAEELAEVQDGVPAGTKAEESAVVQDGALAEAPADAPTNQTARENGNGSGGEVGVNKKGAEKKESNDG